MPASIPPLLLARGVIKTGLSLVLGLILQLSTASVHAMDALDRPIRLDLHAKTRIEDALIDWGTHAGVTVMMSAPAVSHELTHEVRGMLSARKALSLILNDSGLTYTQEGERILITPGSALERAGFGSAGLDTSKRSGGRGPINESDVTQASGPPVEIIIAAQRGEGPQRDAPVSITSLNVDSLVDTEQSRLADYYQNVPGLSIAPGIGSAVNLSIRGLSSGPGNPTVGVCLDEVPVGSSSRYGGQNNSAAPDIDLGDLARLDVLRGPQSTLYGASGFGGLVRLTTLDPSTDAVSAIAQGNLGGIPNSPGIGYGIRGALNAPLSNTLAARVSVLSQRDSGYVDNSETGKNGVNRMDVDGAHLTVLWHPGDMLSLRLSAFLQENKELGSPFANPTLGNLKQSYMAGTGADEQNRQLYSASFNTSVAGIHLTAISSFSLFTTSDSEDWSTVLGPLAQTDYGTSGVRGTESNKLRKFTQEVRLSGSAGTRLDWVAGGFYTDEHALNEQRWLAQDPATRLVAGSLLAGTWSTSFAEYAGFGDLTAHLTDKLDLQLGGRKSFYRQTYREVDTGNYVPLFMGGVPGPLITPETVARDDAWTYLLRPRLRLSPQSTLYARLSSATRPGGPNPACSAFHYPCRYDPDEIRSYELGVREDVPSLATSLDMSLYYVQWRNVQLEFDSPWRALFENAGSAKSRGVELSVGSHPFTGLSISAWAAWNEAMLNKELVTDVADSGDGTNRLPYGARFSGHLTLRQELPLGRELVGFVAGSVSYVGNRLGAFQLERPRQYLPAYAQADVSGGLRYQSWRVTLFVNNVGDRRAVIDGGVDNVNDPNAFYYIRPRTIGLSLLRTF